MGTGCRLLCGGPGKVKPHTESKQTICFTDLMATLAAVTGAALPDDAGPDSFSILPVLLGEQDESAPIRGPLVILSSKDAYTIRSGPWKLIDCLGSGGFFEREPPKPTPGGPEGQLYNLEEDPGETVNLYLRRPEIVQRLRAELGPDPRSRKDPPVKSDSGRFLGARDAWASVRKDWQRAMISFGATALAALSAGGVEKNHPEAFAQSGFVQHASPRFRARLVKHGLTEEGCFRFLNTGALPSRPQLDPAVVKAMKAMETAAAKVASDPTRPTYHLLPASGWMSDPTGPIYHGGYYHAFYLLNPYGDEGWPKSRNHWGHARSKDLVTWEHLPVALYPLADREHRCNSGCSAINAEGKPMIFYTHVPMDQKARNAQWAAFGDDELIAWRKYDGNPVLDLATHDGPGFGMRWRDPFIFQVETGARS